MLLNKGDRVSAGSVFSARLKVMYPQSCVSMCVHVCELHDHV